MNALVDQLTLLKLHGMAQMAAQLLNAKTQPVLSDALKQLIQAEIAERDVRTISYQTRVARFPHHKDFVTFDYTVSAVDKAEIEALASGQFTEQSHNLILVGGTGTGKTHIAVALGYELIQNKKKVRFFNAVDLINQLIVEQAENHQGRLVKKLQAIRIGAVLLHRLDAVHAGRFRLVTLTRENGLAVAGLQSEAKLASLVRVGSN